MEFFALNQMSSQIQLSIFITYSIWKNQLFTIFNHQSVYLLLIIYQIKQKLVFSCTDPFELNSNSNHMSQITCSMSHAARHIPIESNTSDPLHVTSTKATPDKFFCSFWFNAFECNFIVRPFLLLFIIIIK